MESSNAQEQINALNGALDRFSQDVNNIITSSIDNFSSQITSLIADNRVNFQLVIQNEITNTLQQIQSRSVADFQNYIYEQTGNSNLSEFFGDAYNNGNYSINSLLSATIRQGVNSLPSRGGLSFNQSLSDLVSNIGNSNRNI